MDKMPEQVPLKPGVKPEDFDFVPSAEQVDEARLSPEVIETIMRVQAAGYLDTSFDGKIAHTLTVRAHSKEEALTEYKKSGGVVLVSNDIGENMSYTVPSPENLDVIIMDFSSEKSISYDDIVTKMDALGVRPLTFEEQIQYGTTHPSHQELNPLLALGSKHAMADLTYGVVSILKTVDGYRELSESLWGGSGNLTRLRFLATPK